MKPVKIQSLSEQLDEIIKLIDREQEGATSLIEGLHSNHQLSGENLLNYISFRSFDLRSLQKNLGRLGLTRLARAEGHIKSSLTTSKFLLQKLNGEEVTYPGEQPLNPEHSEIIQRKNTRRLLGKERKNRRLRIMVTMPSDAAEKPEMTENMISAGMDVARINCAHDHPDTWKKIVRNIRSASDKLNRSVRIAMDLSGPKIRTGQIEQGPQIKSFLPDRDAEGKVLHPAVVHLVSSSKSNLKSPDLPIDKSWWKELKIHDEIIFNDARGKLRKLKVVSITQKMVVTHSQDSIFIRPGTILKADHGETSVGKLPAIAQSIVLRPGDTLILKKERIVGHPSKLDEEGHQITPAEISCTLPEALDFVEVGHEVFFDDGKISGIVSGRDDDSLTLKIKKCKKSGAKLRADKGINFPDSNLQVFGLTEKDREDLEFVVEHSDIACLSFVNTPEDVKQLLTELERLNALDKIGIVLKIETKLGYDNLSRIILEAMKAPRIGVMLARGDLAIEVGWKNMGAIQKEILGLCNASHIPLIWATQVLEGLAKKGLPSRAEITDTVNATKADCIMLNKGPHILSAIELLNEIIESSEVYQIKNAPMLPRMEKISLQAKTAS